MNSKGSSSAISLPKGGGALHGIGEKFSPDLYTGTVSLGYAEYLDLQMAARVAK